MQENASFGIELFPYNHNIINQVLCQKSKTIFENQ